MTALPETIPLDHPRGDPAALDELVQAVARVAHLLTVLAGDLTGPSAAAPGWLGADATAAAAQIGSVAGLSHQMAGAVLLATARLSAYADRLGEARRRVDALREEQDEDYRRAWRLVSELPDPQAEFRFGGPAAAAVVEEFRAGEDSRRRRTRPC
ncbi:hypothetical protein [Blastococcus sp. PRF04-17]|uniref:hypothetical protein n=1 Tax=Blastococcus sp. PRF04-17 TaxID=2933797 RepID=UPI001FF44C1B|nr:hypothetical protein [Blastococcus sp. PRF04-17]UOY01020.1 hypothetical protein MVA48_18910 [Blastococcus sp. PRF04-17]